MCEKCDRLNYVPPSEFIRSVQRRYNRAISNIVQRQYERSKDWGAVNVTLTNAEMERERLRKRTRDMDEECRKLLNAMVGHWLLKAEPGFWDKGYIDVEEMLREV